MLRIIDLEQLTKDQEAQTVFTFLTGTERHGIPASELLDWLRSRALQGASGKSGSRKGNAQRKSSATEAFEGSDAHPPLLSDGNSELSEESSLS